MSDNIKKSVKGAKTASSSNSQSIKKRQRAQIAYSDDSEQEDKKPPAKPARKRKVQDGATTTKRAPSSKKVKLEKEDEEDDKKPIVNQLHLKAEPCDDDDVVVLWDAAEVLAYQQQVAPNVAHNIVRLLDEDNTVPFIARYRRGLTDNMEAEQLREIKHAYEQLKVVATKARNLVRQISQAGQLTPDVKSTVLMCQSISELDHVAAPYKTGGKRTLAERARALGLEEPAKCLLAGMQLVNPHSLVKYDKEGLGSVQEVETGLQHLLADAISKDPQVLAEVRKLKSREFLTLESSKARAAKQSSSSKADKPASKVKSSAKDKVGHKAATKNADESKFTAYFQFSTPIRNVKPHQVLAINRGEKLKFLSVKVTMRDSFWNMLHKFCESRFLAQGMQSPFRTSMCQRSFQDAWQRLLQPLVCRQVRAELTQNAEKASLEVFADNLKHLLLMPPLKGCTVLGIDPGFLHGCKLAVVAPSGDLLHSDVIYPKFGNNALNDTASRILQEIVMKYSCDVVALGNGTACRETEAWLGAMLAAQCFSPLDLKYTVVSEQGASIYSCSPEAKQEFPKLDINHISAVSIARRLQEPLAELVKVEPRHLGVGMYQHDLPDTRLRATLDEVVQQCVSFVGVDLNTASLFLLRRVAGLSDARAKNILGWRTEHGAFTCRQQLLKVKGIGAKTFEQCAGFVRVMAVSSGISSKSKGTENAATPLDSTNVHPESYKAAHKLLQLCGARLEDLGSTNFISKVKTFSNKTGTDALVTKLGLADMQAVLQLVEALTQGPAYDPRARMQGPIFRRGVTTIEELTPGTELTGCVQNVTHFGAFVDIGVGTSGLVHVSAMRGTQLALGNRVSVKVMNVDAGRRRIGLELLSVLN